MATMTTDAIASKLKQICELRKQIKSLQKTRETAELAIAVQYKVDECNKARDASAASFHTQISALVSQIAALEDELGT